MSQSTSQPYILSQSVADRKRIGSRRIFWTIVIFYLPLFLLSYLQELDIDKAVNLPLMVVLGAVTGVISGLAIPMAVPLKLLYIAKVACSLLFIVVGFRFRQYLWAQVMTVIGIVCWTLVGIKGLGL